jgi:pimeloyl-ACP methyl ester carboxylesterase
MPYFMYQGRRLFYREQGSGPPLLILPGNTASSACHPGELAHFGQRYRAVALDFLGVGQSDRVAVWPHNWWAEGATAAVALLDQLGVEQCIAVGASGGAAIALLLAIQRPERVRAVVADSVVARIPADALRALLAERAQRTPGQVAFWRQAHGDDWAQVVDADTMMLASHAATGIDYFQDRLAQIGCPTLLTASLLDPLLPAVASQICAMARQIPQSRLFLVNGGDHPLMWSRASEFRAVADAFLALV